MHLPRWLQMSCVCSEIPLRLSYTRWDRVSALVPGKSKAQCFKRFKGLRDAHRARKDMKGNNTEEVDD